MRRQGLLVLGLVTVAGCAAPGNPFGLAPQGQRLLPETKIARSVAVDPAPLPRELDKRLHPTFVVEPGDVLLVQPANFDSPARLPGDQPVLPDGTVNLGRYGRLVVAGKTVDQIEAEVRTVVEAQTKDAGPISVRIVTRNSKVFYVLGEVNAPGSYPLAGRETVLDAIMAAGGVSPNASLKNIVLSRPTLPDGCRIVLPICYEQIVQLGDTSTNYQIAAGDRIFVAAKGTFEDLFAHKKKDCGPCNRAQVPCTSLDCSSADACPRYAPATLLQPKTVQD